LIASRFGTTVRTVMETPMTAATAGSIQMVASYTLFVVSVLAAVLAIAGMAMIGIAVYEAVGYARTCHFPRSLHLSRLLHVSRGR
jgi:hypothetical protein